MESAPQNFQEHDRGPAGFEFGFLVHDVSRLRRRVFDYALKPLGITRSQWWVLAHLSRHQPATSTELAKILDIGGVALSMLLDRLAAKNYIVRYKVATDRRIRQIELTPKGKSLLRTMQERTSGLNQEMMSDITPDEILRLDDILHRMKLRLKNMNNESKAERSFSRQQEKEESASFL